MNVRARVIVGAMAAVFAAGSAACKKAETTPPQTGQAAPAPTLTAGDPATCPGGTCPDAGTFRCPMVAECAYFQQGPGRCPKCGMFLEPVPAEASPQGGAGTPPAAQPSPAAPLAAQPAVAAAEVKTAAELAPDRVGQTATCPVSGHPFTVTADTPAVQHEGQIRLFCCPHCPPKFLADPAKYLSGAHREGCGRPCDHAGHGQGAQGHAGHAH